MSRWLIGISLLVVCACGSSAPTAPTAPSESTGPRTAYVSITGNDRNDGTLAAPWLTLRYAVSQLRKGDTLYVRGGIYTGPANTIDSSLGTIPSGASWTNAVTIAGYPNETPTIQHPDGTAGIQLIGSGYQYIIFQDLIVDGINGTNNNISAIVYLSQGANHVRFLRVEVKNAWTSGFNIFSSGGVDSPFNEVLSSKVHGNGRRPVTNSGYGFYVNATDNLFEGNEVYENGGYGMQIYNDRNILRKNTIHDNGVNFADPVGDQGGDTSYGIDIGAAVAAHSDNNQVYDNLIYGNRGGILVYTNSSNTDVHNNTIYSNTPLEGILIQYARNASIRDNAVYANGTDVLDLGTGTILSNNRGGP